MTRIKAEGLETRVPASSSFLWVVGSRVRARETSNSAETMRLAICESGGSSEEPATRTPGNDYSGEPCLDQEYQIIAEINDDYTHLLHTVPRDYELLTIKGKSVC